ncbi:hypothetical protein [Paracoccus sp. (in: a-proteobacteria)]|uniref:hypothetical protein n=1 Tax=Paracoccus sp. TaxID=267 RepID=UPI0028AB4283|nr:hypothetical protein [Paracoccus sp. (in: a-proteobacteria)]
MAGKPKYKSTPATPMNQWVRDALESCGMTQTALAEALSGVEGLGSYDRSIVYKMTVSRRVQIKEAKAISQITKYPLPDSETDSESALDACFREIYLKLLPENRQTALSVVEGLLARQEGGGQEQ